MLKTMLYGFLLIVLILVSAPLMAESQVEADSSTIVKCTSGEAVAVNFAEDGYADTGEFTDDLTLHWRDAADVGAVLEIAVPVDKTGRYSISVRLGKYRTFGTFQFVVNGKNIGKPVDCFGNPGHDIVTPFTADLGEAALNAGENRLALRLVGTNPETIMANHGACVDWVKLSFAGEVETGGGGGTGGGTAGPDKVYEADQLHVNRCTSGEATTAKLAEDGYAEEGEFTGDRSLQWHDAANKGAVLDLALPVASKGRYTVTVRAAKYRTYGIHQFVVNGKNIGKPVDMFGNPGQDIVTAFTVKLGTVDLRAGVNQLALRLVGTNPSTIMPNHGAGLDWVSLQPVASPKPVPKPKKP